MVSGLYVIVLVVSNDCCVVTYISDVLVLLKSFPFSPAFMKVGPSHRIKQKEIVKASPLNASDAIRGSPSASPEKVFARIPQHAAVRDNRVRVSVKLK